MSHSSEEDVRKGSRRRPHSSSPWRKRSPVRKAQKSRSRSRSRSTRSSSRGTYDDLDESSSSSTANKEPAPFSCKQCARSFHTIRELSEHEVRVHEGEIGCGLCEKKSVTISRLAAHTKHRHGLKPVVCYYCNLTFGACAFKMKEVEWDDFRDHVHKEVVKKRMYKHGTDLTQSSGSSKLQALRGVGPCPHGPPVKCKNFPQCPGAKCIYSHNQCRYASECNKTTCPFDHPNRPRTCMSCVNDMKSKRSSGRK